MKLRVLDLFSGIGGFSLGLERTGKAKTVGFVEINKAAQKVLTAHWSGVPVFDDVRNFRFDKSVGLVTAGFPCQDISNAGLRTGLRGGNSSLFWCVLRTLRMVGRPRVLLENVAALLDRGMGDVCGSLATFGYDAEWHCIPASAVGAPHRRDRIWIVADPQRDEQSREEPCVGPFGRMGRLKQSVAWDGGWETALSSLRGMDDGLSRSVDRTDGLRNAVVPQVVTQIGEALLSEAA